MAPVPGTLQNIPGPARSRPGDQPPEYAAELDRALRAKVRGEVRFEPGSRALYSTDGSNYRQAPIGVVIPLDAADIEAAVAVCREFDAPVTARGGGTSLAGQTTNTTVIIDCGKYMRGVLELDARRKRARVQPGIVLDDLRNRAEEHHLTFAPDPATHDHCTLGGMLGNNSCGVHSVMGGKTDDNTEELEILTYDGLRMRVGKTSERELDRIVAAGGRRGEIYAGMKRIRDRYGDLIRQRYPDIPRRVSGYNLPYLLPEKGFDVAKALVGSENTLVFILEATLRLVPSPPVRSLLLLGYPDITVAADHVMEVLAAGPIACEAIDDYLVENMRRKGLHMGDIQFLPEGKGWLLVEFGGRSKEESDDQAWELIRRLKKGKDAPHVKLYDDPKQERLVWEIRESGLGATAFVPGEPVTWEGWEDSAVPPQQMGGYLRQLKKLYTKHGYVGALYGHFGQGCLHTRINFDFKTPEGVRNYRAFMEEAADLVVSFGGSLSGEHGDGQSRAELLPRMFGEEMIRVFNEFKALWDPRNRMNPGKVVHPYRIDENLKHGLDYNPPLLKTHFSFFEEGGWAGAVDRCVGVGKCRREGSGTMCPSFMVTHEENDCTRGRSRVLFEMLQGEIFDTGWRSREVKSALDLCLSCKGCKGDCPVNVDMATYKAEFLSHYYRNRIRPPHAYSMGLIFWWARLASKAPGVANFLTQTPGIRSLVKAAGGISQHRSLPKFAAESFQDWFARRGPRNLSGPEVVLWPDTFNNYFHPETARAAVGVLESAGFRVIVPQEKICCGRPLYDYGMLDLAKKVLLDSITVLRPYIRRGVPMVGLEPSCVAVFRDELKNLFPEYDDGERLTKQTFTLGEFLEKHVRGYHAPRLYRDALLHGHCHHKAVMKLGAEEKLLRSTGLEVEVIDSGCCGMAGSFGFEAGKYDFSMQCGERVLLPAVRNAPKDTIIVADGFSCREQIRQGTDRGALHTAEVLDLARRTGKEGPKGRYPERMYKKEAARETHPREALAGSRRPVPGREPAGESAGTRARGGPEESSFGGALLAVAAGAALAGGIAFWLMRRNGHDQQPSRPVDEAAMETTHVS